MNRTMKWVLMGSMAVFMVFCKLPCASMGVLQILSLLAAMAMAAALIFLIRRKAASPIHKAMVATVVLACLCILGWPTGPGRWVRGSPLALLYAVFFWMAIIPLWIHREVFTMYFARKTTPEAVWETDLFRTINHHLTWVWAGLFFLSFLSALVPRVFSVPGWGSEMVFEGLVPALFMVGLGIPLNRRYPAYYQKKVRIPPKEEVRRAQEKKGPDAGSRARETTEKTAYQHQLEKGGNMMTEEKKIVAINGSPHAGVGNTAMMIEMLRSPLADSGYDLEVIHLSEYEVRFCTGCGLCLEKGKCWIHDDHREIVQKLLAAQGIVLASPVYFMHVTAQTKTFIDRSLAYGHKPRGTWKPGLGISVSAGLGETQTAQYLAAMLRPFGAFAVGTLTAMATSVGGFMGKPVVEARAADLARDLARAIDEKRRYPATDMDLRYYQFMGNLVRSHKDTVMKDDYTHWQEKGLFDGFEAFIQQSEAEAVYDPAMRDAWIKEMIARQKAEKQEKTGSAEKASSTSGPREAKTCKELLQMMPHGFNPDAAEGLDTVYQFEISGDEAFVAHLRIVDNTCTYADGPADHPGVVVKSPSDVWLAISKGELDGQQAFMSGKYTIEGDLTLLMRLRTLFTPR